MLGRACSILATETSIPTTYASTKLPFRAYLANFLATAGDHDVKIQSCLHINTGNRSPDTSNSELLPVLELHVVINKPQECQVYTPTVNKVC